MARRKGASASELSRKRGKASHVVDDTIDERPLKRHRSLQQSKKVLQQDQDEHEGGVEAESAREASPVDDVATPTRRKRGRPSVDSAQNPANDHAVTPSGRKGRKIFETPLKSNGVSSIDTPSRRTIADRSARRKSARALIDRVVAGSTSEDEAGDEELVREIYESSESEEDEEQEPEANEESEVEGDVEEDPPSAAATPSKRPRGRPRKPIVRKKSPTPPRDLPRHEQYFYQNRPGSTKTSNHNLSNLKLLTHEEYFNVLNEYKDPHADDIRYLQSLHAESFPQWTFELSQGFSLCLYGFGSKKPLLHQFANHLYSQTEDHDTNKIVVINGYVPTISIREILTTIGIAISPSAKVATGNPATTLQNVLSLLSAHPVRLTLVLNSIDAIPLRKPVAQAALARLAAHPHTQLVCSADTPSFALLWDSALRSRFNFAFHDATTFAPRAAAEADVPDEVHELLGRRARRVGGRDGVAFVLRSLPGNAQSLFRLLVGEVLVALDEQQGADGGENPGVEYRMLYNRAVEEFICSSEMAFRTLLKEFHDHQMITSRKDIIGTELLSLPFRREELEAILEDLTT